MNQTRSNILKSLMTVPNFLSFLRIPLAFIFLIGNPTIRFTAVLIAGLTDLMDGYIARRYKLVSKIGKILDPLTDKFFVFFVLVIFMQEGMLGLWQITALMCRDIALLLFGSYLFIQGRFTQYKVRTFWCGKVVTAMQFLILLSLSLGIEIPIYIYFMFPLMGGLALIELYLFHTSCFSAR